MLNHELGIKIGDKRKRHRRQEKYLNQIILFLY